MFWSAWGEIRSHPTHVRLIIHRGYVQLSCMWNFFFILIVANRFGLCFGNIHQREPSLWFTVLSQCWWKRFTMIQLCWITSLWFIQQHPKWLKHAHLDGSKREFLALCDGGKKWVFVASDRVFPVRRPAAGSHSPNGNLQWPWAGSREYRQRGFTK